MASELSDTEPTDLGSRLLEAIPIVIHTLGPTWEAQGLCVLRAVSSEALEVFDRATRRLNLFATFVPDGSQYGEDSVAQVAEAAKAGARLFGRGGGRLQPREICAYLGLLGQ